MEVELATCTPVIASNTTALLAVGTCHESGRCGSGSGSIDRTKIANPRGQTSARVMVVGHVVVAVGVAVGVGGEVGVTIGIVAVGLGGHTMGVAHLRQVLREP